MGRVLLVDDSLDCQILVSRTLEGSAQLSVASDLAEAKRMLSANDYELLLLDVALPDGDGFGFCSSLLAERGHKRPRIVFLTGSNTLADRLTGFNVGGDDYVSKPFDAMELRARVLAHLRAKDEAHKAAEGVRVGNLFLDLASYSAKIETPEASIPLDLTPTEFKLLHHLARHEGRIQTREELLQMLFSGRTHVTDRTIDAHLCRVRKKLQPCTHQIEPVYGIGYRLAKT